MKDQQDFAGLSGDYNPMHMNPVAARRTPAGGAVVHGVHLLLWSLEVAAEQFGEDSEISDLRVDFNTFLIVGQSVDLRTYHDTKRLRIVLSSAGSTIMTLELRFGGRGSFVHAIRDASTPVLSPDCEAFDLNFEEICRASGHVPLFRALADYEAMFPKAAEWLDVKRIAGFACASRIVGMVCPGLHSIFNRIEAKFCEISESNGLCFSVINSDDRFRRVKIEAFGCGIFANLLAVARVPPVKQPDIGSLAHKITRGAFAGVNALIIGGSRGLGELTAKILAAGGASVTITYWLGQSDAQRIANEINATGGACEVVAFDVRAPTEGQLGTLINNKSHIYYYATPKISVPNSRVFDAKRFEGFLEIYVYAFYELCKLVEVERSNIVDILYPSTTYVDVTNRPISMVEYSMAKAAGEVLAEEINRCFKIARVSCVRFPRLLTDQTVGTLEQSAPTVGTDILLEVIGAFHRPK